MIEGVEYLHKTGIIHTDLKPHNLLLDSQFNVKIADLGLAAPRSGIQGSGLLQGRTGTYYYMAPEVFSDERYDGQAADIYSIGVILFQMITQDIPFKAHGDSPESYYTLLT